MLAASATWPILLASAKAAARRPSINGRAKRSTFAFGALSRRRKTGPELRVLGHPDGVWDRIFTRPILGRRPPQATLGRRSAA